VLQVVLLQHLLVEQIIGVSLVAQAVVQVQVVAVD
jgi:hypothetical protein